MIGVPALIAVSLAGDPGLSLADLPAYREALHASPSLDAPTVPFRQLWDQPERFRGHPIRVRGRAVRRFRTGPIGELPARAEIWLLMPSGDLICGVYPDLKDAIPIGSLISFTGTSLGRVSYASGDVTRLAPLVVGSRPPTILTVASSRPDPSPIEDQSAWIVAAVLGAMVVVVLISRRRGRRPLPTMLERPPIFLESPADDPRMG